MKRIGGLFERIAERGNLAAAAWKAGRGKRVRPEVRRFFADFERECNAIVVELGSGSYRVGGYRVFAIRDPKTRAIHAPSFRDRVVHHAVLNIAGPTFELGAIDHSYACREGKGQHAALRQARTWTRRGGWYGKVDVRKFYDRVDHAQLRHLLARRFRERRLLSLFDALLGSYSATAGRGLPIGALTSQYLGNFYLDRLDARMKASGFARRYLRYMDDIVVWGSRHELRSARDVAGRALGELGLEMKHGGEWNRCAQGVPLLGFVVYPDRVRLGRVGRRRLRRKLSALERSWRLGQVTEAELQSRGEALFAHPAFADDINWRRAVLAARAFDDHDLGRAGTRNA